VPGDLADDHPGTGMTAPAASAVAIGDSVTPFSRTVTQEQINAYADASGDPNPIHLDPDFARSVGLPGTIAHGMLEMGILADAIASWAGGSANLIGLSCRFSKPLLPGDTIICTGTVVSVDDAGVAILEVGASSDRGDRVLTNGRATVRLSR
jgi:acyl dehydratase